MDDYNKIDDFENSDRKREEIFSKAVKAGKRTYFFDVKATRKDDYYITITESKKKTSPDGSFFYEKHKIFLYKEDFEKFIDGLNEVVDYVRINKADSFEPDKTEENLTNPDID
ncbi:MAG: DNA-binding protein [Bacteroidetes bacterium HGW-Bacteroidetes-21]|jgi:hypothetical protein|nr:MAG: DNA-binding protein [Bacteroidetes bacterium HGW-Bacteroidetes-21]